MSRQAAPGAGLAGWFGAGLAAAALLGALGAALLRTETSDVPLMLDLGQVPPAAPAIAALAEAAPDAQDDASDPAAPPQPSADPPPLSPSPEAAVSQSSAPDVTLPAPDVPALSDLSVPAAMPAEQAVSDASPPQIAPPRPDAPPRRPAREAVAKPQAPAAPVASAAPSAPSPGVIAKGGGKPVSTAAYARSVLKKVRATRRQPGVGKGVVVVGFSVAGDGGVARVGILQSSGNPALDRLAVGHIERSAPFPPPPAGVGRSFSFEFVGR